MANTSLDTPPGRNDLSQPEESNPLRRISVNSLSAYLTVGSALMSVVSLLWLAFWQLSGVPLGICLGLLSAFTFVLVMVGIFVVQNRPSESIGRWLPDAPAPILPDEDAKRSLRLTNEDEAKKLQDHIEEIEKDKVGLEKKIGNLNAKHKAEIENLNEKITSLKIQHDREIDGRRNAFGELQRNHDVLKDRLAEWEKYAWIVSTADAQARDISQYVLLLRVVMMISPPPSLEIMFYFHIRNKSNYNITVDVPMNEFIHFNGKALYYAIRVINKDFECPPLEDRELGIEQPLREEEAKRILEFEDNAYFYFSLDSLNISIKGADEHLPRIISQRLITKDKIPTFPAQDAKKLSDRIKELEREKDAIQREYENKISELESDISSLESKLSNQDNYKLKLDIDTTQTLARVEDSVKGCHIFVGIRMRFDNGDRDTLTVKALSLTPNVRSDTGDVRELERGIPSIHSNHFSFFLDDDIGELAARRPFEQLSVEGRTVTKYYWLKADITIASVKNSDLIKGKHFMRLTMSATNQLPFIVDIDVDWRKAMFGLTPVSISHPHLPRT